MSEYGPTGVLEGIRFVFGTRLAAYLLALGVFRGDVPLDEAKDR